MCFQSLGALASVFLDRAARSPRNSIHPATASCWLSDAAQSKAPCDLRAAFAHQKGKAND